MKGALIVCHQSVDLLGELTEAFEHDAEFDVKRTKTVGQLVHKRDRYFTMFSPPAYGEWHSDIEGVSDTICAIDPVDLEGYEAECRWEDLFCNVVRRLAERLPCLLVIDGNGTVHPGGSVDATSIQL